MERPPKVTATTYELVPYDGRRIRRRKLTILFAGCALGLTILAAFGVSNLRSKKHGEPANLRHWSDVVANQAAQIPTSDAAHSQVRAASLDVDNDAPFVLNSSSNELQPTPNFEELHPNDAFAATDHGNDLSQIRMDERGADSFLLVPEASVSSSQFSHEIPQLGRENIIFANTKLQEAIRRAERGALFSSRAMLIETLRDVCRMLDATSGGQEYSTSLVAALTALDEADDFQYRGVHAESDLETDGFVTGHDTSILKGQKGISSLRARDAYYNFARDELTKACCGQAVAAKACYALARVEAMMRRQKATTRRGGPREIPLFQASLNVNPQDHVAANELGVALARAGHLRRAAKTLDESIRLRSDPTAMSNLAKVYQQLGNPQRAAALQQQIANTRTAPAQRVASQVQLVSVDEFGNEHISRINAADAMNSAPAFMPGHTNMPGRAYTDQPRNGGPSPAARPPSRGTLRALWGGFQGANPIRKN